MTLIDNLLQNWSRYEIYMELSLLAGIFVVTIFTIFFTTKNKKISLLSMIALLLTAISNLLGIFLTNLIFSITITEVFRTIPVITALLVISNIGILVGFYLSKKDAKNFKIESIRREYLSDSIKQTVFLILLGSSIFLFSSVQTKSVTSISILSTLSSIWFTYWISKYILK